VEDGPRHADPGSHGVDTHLQIALRTMAEQTHNTDMSDEADRQDLEDRVYQLESTISKMLPSRRDALKLGGAALVGGAAMSGAASAQPGDQDGEAGVIGTDNNPVDIEASDIEVDDLVVNGTATGVAQGLQGCRVFLSSDQTVVSRSEKIQFDSEVYDSGNNFDTSTHNFTCPRTGIYIAQLQVFFRGGGSDQRREIAIGDESLIGGTTSNEGAHTELRNSDQFDKFGTSTVNQYSQGDKIAGYAGNFAVSDVVQSGTQAIDTFMEVVFLGST